MSRATAVIFATAVAALVLIGISLARNGAMEHQSFKAFYCAGEAIREHRDAYRVEPLRSCEAKLAPDLGNGIVEPAPFPGYALGFFALLAFAPAGTAAVTWAVLCVAVVSLSALCLGTICRISPIAALLALAPLLVLNLAYGETPPLGVGALVVAAYLLVRNQMTAAAVVASLSLVQPNIGLTAVIALFVFERRTRVALALCALALACVSVAAIGVRGNVEYFASVLPLQSASEVAASDQYSLSHLLYQSGLASDLSLLLGKLWFIAIVVGGVLVAGIAAKRTGHRELVVLVPPAIALFFGIYLHDIQMLFAIPAALAVAMLVKERSYRAVALVALALLVPVWTQRLGRAAVVIDFAAVASAIAAVIDGSPVQRFARGSLCALAVIVAMILAHRMESPSLVGPVAESISVSPDDYASQSWATFIRSSPALIRPVYVLKIPTWIGLLGILVCTVHLCAKKRLVPQLIEEEAVSFALD